MTKLVYILAASHSGSTLLAMLLGTHRDVCSVGELKWTSLGDVERYRCSCRSLVTQCQFWAGVREGMRRRGYAFDFANPQTDVRATATRYERRLLRPLHRGPAFELLRDTALALSPGWSSRLRAHQDRNSAFIASILEQSGKRVLVDSSKIGVRLKYLLRAPGLDVRVIRLVRDGRAVAQTYTDPATFADASDPALKGGGSGDARDGERLSMYDAAREWRRSNEEAEALLAALPRSRWTHVSYEQLCTNSERILEALFTFIGADPSAPRVDFRNTDHHVIGNGMRLDSTSEIRLDDRWLRTLSGADLETFAVVAGPLNSRLGYV